MEPAAVACDAQQRLVLRVANRNDHAAAHCQLFEQRLGRVRRSRGNDNGVIRRMVGPADGAVADVKRDIVISEAVQQRLRIAL